MYNWEAFTFVLYGWRYWWFFIYIFKVPTMYIVHCTYYYYVRRTVYSHIILQVDINTHFEVERHSGGQPVEGE